MSGSRDDRGDGGEPPLVQLAHYSGHGLTIALSTGLFLLAGWWVDGKLGVRPLFTIAGALLGAAAGFWSVIQHLLLRPRDEEARRRAGAPSLRDGSTTREDGSSEGDGPGRARPGDQEPEDRP
jgi:hypothetical protein